MEPLSVGGVFDVCLHVFLACKCLNRFQLVVSDYDLQLSSTCYSHFFRQNAADDFSTEWNWLCHWWPFDCPACQQWGLDLADDTGSNQKLLGTLNVVLKVTVSCLAAVLTDRYTKHFKDPVYIQAIQLRLSRTLLLLTLVNWYLFLSGKSCLFMFVCRSFANKGSTPFHRERKTSEVVLLGRLWRPNASVWFLSWLGLLHSAGGSNAHAEGMEHFVSLGVSGFCVLALHQYQTWEPQMSMTYMNVLVSCWIP